MTRPKGTPSAQPSDPSANLIMQKAGCTKEQAEMVASDLKRAGLRPLESLEPDESFDYGTWYRAEVGGETYYMLIGGQGLLKEVRQGSRRGEIRYQIIE